MDAAAATITGGSTSLVLNLVLSVQTQVAQLKIKLAQLGFYDAAEAALTGGPTSAATISWMTGGPVNMGGAPATVVQSVLGYNMPTMTALLATCAAIVQ